LNALITQKKKNTKKLKKQPKRFLGGASPAQPKSTATENDPSTRVQKGSKQE